MTTVQPHKHRQQATSDTFHMQRPESSDSSKLMTINGSPFPAQILTVAIRNVINPWSASFLWSTVQFKTSQKACGLLSVNNQLDWWHSGSCYFHREGFLLCNIRQNIAVFSTTCTATRINQYPQNIKHESLQSGTLGSIFRQVWKSSYCCNHYHYYKKAVLTPFLTIIQYVQKMRCIISWQ